MEKYLLTIAIPTYNRAEQLRKTLEIVVPQVVSHPEVQLIVVDNASDVPSADVLAEVVNGDYCGGRITVVRNVSNIGGNPNILRCFELAEGEWLWCLSDDDHPTPDALDTILSDCRKGGYCYAYYQLKEGVPALGDVPGGCLIGNDIDEWVKRIPAYGQRLFISESIFHLEDVLPYLFYGYQVASSGSPHLTMAFLAVANGKNYLLSSKPIASYQRPAGGKLSYNCASLAYACAGIFSLAVKNVPYSKIRRFYFDSFSGWLSPAFLLGQMYDMHGEMRWSEFRKCFAIVSMMFKPSLLKDYKRWGYWTVFQILVYVPMLCKKVVSFRLRKALWR